MYMYPGVSQLPDLLAAEDPTCHVRAERESNNIHRSVREGNASSHSSSSSSVGFVEIPQAGDDTCRNTSCTRQHTPSPINSRVNVLLHFTSIQVVVQYPFHHLTQKRRLPVPAE